MRRPRRHRCTSAVLMALGLMVASCGSVDAPSAGTAPAEGSSERSTATPQWTRQLLTGGQGHDSSPQVVSDGEDVIAVLVSEDGMISGFATDDQGTFQPGTPTDTGIAHLAVGGVVRTDAGWLALGHGGLEGTQPDQRLTFDVHAFASPDGRSWLPLDATGLGGPAEVTGLARTDAGYLVAVGTRRDAEDPAMGGLEPTAWHSQDGTTWTSVPLPPGGEGWVSGVAVVGNRVLAVGHSARGGTLWVSTDDGATWAVDQPEGLPTTTELNDLAALDDVVVLSGRRTTDDGGGQVLARSTDGGQRWQAVTAPPLPGRGGGRAEAIPFPLFTGGQRYFTLSYSYVQAFADPELCYADIQLCRQDLAVALYESEDGDRWRRIDTSGIDPGGAGDDVGEVDGITGTPSGRLVAHRTGQEGVTTWSWPAGASLPTGAEPAAPTTDVDVLPGDAAPEPGRRYAAPLYIHCGMDWLFVAGDAWQRTDGSADVETGAGDRVPDHWPVAQETIFGFITLVADDVIEYSIGDGEVIATYEPATEEPPGCA